MLRWMCVVPLRGKVSSVKLRKRMGIGLVTEDVKRNRLRWLEHVLWKDGGDWVKRNILYEVDKVRGRGNPRMTCNTKVEKDTSECGLNKVNAQV